MTMADPRTPMQRDKEFSRNKARIEGIVDELIAVNTLEHHNKNWLSGDNKTRREAFGDTLLSLKREIQELRR